MKYFDGEGCGTSLAESEVLTEVVALKVTVFTFSQLLKQLYYTDQSRDGRI